MNMSGGDLPKQHLPLRVYATLYLAVQTSTTAAVFAKPPCLLFCLAYFQQDVEFEIALRQQLLYLGAPLLESKPCSLHNSLPVLGSQASTNEAARM